MGVGVGVDVGDGPGRGQDEPAGLDPFGADQAVRQLADQLGRAAEEDHLEAAVGVEMHVGRGHHAFEVEVLDFGEPFRDSAGVVVVDQGDDPHRVAVVDGDHVFDQGGPHQATHRFAAVRVLMDFAVLVEFLEQFAADGDTEPDQGSFTVPRFLSRGGAESR